MTLPAPLPGNHLLLDFEGARMLDAVGIEAALRRAAAAAGARVLGAMLHPFPGGGVTGVLLLAESHISVHSWPETGFVALDIFMCGASDVDRARAVLEAAFEPARVSATLCARGPQDAPVS